MSCYLIYYENGAKMMRPVLTATEYRNLRNTEKQQKIIESVRNGSPSPQPSPIRGEGVVSDASKLKMRLSQFNYSCIPETSPNLPQGEGFLKGCTTPSNSVGMDIDSPPILPPMGENGYLGDTKEEWMKNVVEKILAKKEELGLLMLERSATKGYHIVFKRHHELSQEENLRWASDLLGVEFDKGAKDITRVFFTTTASEEDLLYLSDELFETSPCPSQGGEKGENANNDSANALSSAMSSLQDSSKHDGVLESLPIKGEMGKAQRGSLSYLGIPYASIIKKWWQMYNDGQEPVKSNRNVLTYELAVNLRHICGFDREMLRLVIPCYDGFSEAEKMTCIDSALSTKMTQMPRRLKDVIAELKRELLNDSASDNADIVAALEQADAQDMLYHYDRLPRMPQGVRDSIDAAGHQLAMPTLIAIAPAIGALATGVKLDVHGKARGLNLCSFVVGEFASGKGQMDDIIATWMNELQAEADVYTMEEEEWATKTNRMKSGKAPEQPKLPVRMLTLNNTVANIASRLANTEGKHSFSFTPEADNVALKWKQSVSDFSVMLRQAYDEARYDREAKSADAVRVHIQKLLWNVTMCGTQDALYRVITNYTDGLLSRIAIARTPDNTFAPLEEDTAQMTELQAQHIKQIAHLLPLMQGVAVLPKLEARGRAWLEMIRLEAMKNDDRVLARQRMRGCVNAQRITAALWLPRVLESLIRKHGFSGAEKRLRKDPELWVGMLKKQQTEEMMQLFDIVADYLLDNDLYFFRERIEAAYDGRNYHGNVNSVRKRRGKNDSIYERLSPEFTFEQAIQQSVAEKGGAATHNSVQQMLKNWNKQGLVAPTPEGNWKKVLDYSHQCH